MNVMNALLKEASRIAISDGRAVSLAAQGPVGVECKNTLQARFQAEVRIAEWANVFIRAGWKPRIRVKAVTVRHPSGLVDVTINATAVAPGKVAEIGKAISAMPRARVKR